jgi:uncharacterized membrane protein
MISGHYPLLVGHRYNWLLLAGFGAASVMARHFFNLKHRGREQRALIVGAGALFLVTIFVASIKPATAARASLKVSDAAVVAITEKHCASCHSAAPTHPRVAAPPLGLILETLDEVRVRAKDIRAQAVDAEIMPPGNETGMTAAERAALGAWLDKQETPE